MKVAFDLDGTVFAEPELWTAIAQGLKAAGNSTGILTARNPSAHKQFDMARLRDMGFPVDFYYGKEELDQDGSAESRKRWKIGEMGRRGIDYLFDDFGTGVPQLYCNHSYAYSPVRY